MTAASDRLERMIGIVLRAGVTASSICLAVGAVLSFVPIEPLSSLFLQTGVIVLLATPVARVVISIVEYIAERDWPFVALTVIVLIELLASAVAALFFNRRM